MNSEIKIHLEEELNILFKQAGCTNQYLQKFKTAYFDAFSEFQKETEDEEAKNDALWITIEKIKRFMQEINAGHSEKWASLLLSNGIDYDEKNTNSAYYELSKQDRELALQEIQIRSKSFGEDEIFEKYYISLFIKAYGAKNPFETAKKYSQCYRKLIEQRKSAVYAHYYADRATEDYADNSCEKFAYAMEQALLQGLDESQAFFIADEFANEICNEHIYFYASKYIKCLQKNAQYLSKYFDDITDEVTKGAFENYFSRLTEEQLEGYILDSVILYEKKCVIQK